MSEIKERILAFCDMLLCNKKRIDKRYEDLFEFMKWGIKNLPDIVKKNIKSDNILISTRDGASYVSFTLADYHWWKNYHNQNPLVQIKDIKIIEKNILDKIDNLTTNTQFDISKEELEETLKKIDELYSH